MLIKMLEPKVFDTFIQENMKLSTYKAEWKDEISDVQVCANKVYQAYLAEYSAATVGSIIDKNAEKPTHQMPTAKELVGAIGRMGDEWQMDNDRLDQFYYLEGRYNDRKGTYSAEMRDAEFQKLVKFLFDPFENAVIAPQKRIDMLYFEGLFKGTQTVNATNNTKSGVSWTYNLGVTSYKTQTATWATSATAKPIEDIQYVVDAIEAKGKTVQRIRMSKRTFRAMVACAEIQNAFKMTLNKVDVNGTLPISLEAVNTYLESILLPTIEIEKDRFSTLANGTGINLVPDNRVVFQCADKVAVLKVSDPLEAIDKLPNKSYSTYDNNLVGAWRDNHGRFVDYEMWATPVFTGKNDYFILKTDEN